MAFVLTRTGAPLWASVLVGAAVAILLGFGVDFAVIRRLRRGI